MMTSGADAPVTKLNISSIVGPSGALDPEQAIAVARRVVDAERFSVAILDFTGASALSSGFANALFLELAKERPIDEWRHRLQFEGLNSIGKMVLTRSLNAVRARMEL